MERRLQIMVDKELLLEELNSLGVQVRDDGKVNVTQLEAALSADAAKKLAVRMLDNDEEFRSRTFREAINCHPDPDARAKYIGKSYIKMMKDKGKLAAYTEDEVFRLEYAIQREAVNRLP